LFVLQTGAGARNKTLQLHGTAHRVAMLQVQDIFITQKSLLVMLIYTFSGTSTIELAMKASVSVNYIALWFLENTERPV
jgi:hypothetical protein